MKKYPFKCTVVHTDAFTFFFLEKRKPKIDLDDKLDGNFKQGE